MMIGDTSVHVRKPRISIKRHKDLIKLNGHKIYPYYSHGGPRMWPTYGVCFKCGHSILGGADSWFGAIKCGDMD
jgi:hypothetical protein